MPKRKKLKPQKLHSLTPLKIHLRRNWIFYTLIFLLILLLFKDPFSGKNAISSFFPFPDALIYINMSQNIIEGKGSVVLYKELQLDSTVPPLYSFTLTPALLIFKDPRSFYFINILLTFISAIFFYKILSQLFKSNLIIFILFLVFVTNSIIFTFPTLAMAENLLICLFILSIYFLLGPVSIKKSIFIGVLTIAFFAAKYVAWTLSLSLAATYLILIWSQKNKAERLKLLLYYFCFLSISFLIFLYSESLSKEQSIHNLLRQYFGYLTLITSLIFNRGPASQVGEANPAFSASYISDNLLRYFASLMGGLSSVAGRDLPTIPIIVGMGSLIGIFVNFFLSKFKLLSFYFFLVFLSTLVFIMFFFATDTRYILVLIPLQILSFGILLTSILSFLEAKQLILSKYIITAICVIGIIYNIYLPIKNQLYLNFFAPDYSSPFETVEFYNQNFSNSPIEPKPLVISLLPPLFVDHYSNNSYSLLPFSRFQHFMNKPEIWNIPENGMLFDIYKTYLREGREVYLSDYYAESDFFAATYSLYKQNFNLTEESQGCQNRCKLFKLELKSN